MFESENSKSWMIKDEKNISCMMLIILTHCYTCCEASAISNRVKSSRNVIRSIIVLIIVCARFKPWVVSCERFFGCAWFPWFQWSQKYYPEKVSVMFCDLNCVVILGLLSYYHSSINYCKNNVIPDGHHSTSVSTSVSLWSSWNWTCGGKNVVLSSNILAPFILNISQLEYHANRRIKWKMHL